MRITCSLLISLSPLGGIHLFSFPIGPPSYCEESLLQRIGKVRYILVKLSDLQDSEMKTTFLCSCLAILKVAYALCTCPPSFICQALLTFDNLMRDALSHLAGAPLSVWSWHKASLPYSLGGLGIQKAVLQPPAANLSSYLQSQFLVSDILGYIPLSFDLQSMVASQAEAVWKPEWLSVEDVSCQSTYILFPGLLMRRAIQLW